MPMPSATRACSGSRCFVMRPDSVAAGQKRLVAPANPNPASAATTLGLRPHTSRRIPGPTVSGNVRSRKARRSSSRSNPAPAMTSSTRAFRGSSHSTTSPGVVDQWTRASATGRRTRGTDRSLCTPAALPTVRTLTGVSVDLTVQERILEAGYACVARYGLAKTTVEDVARASGLSRATLYRYFPGGRDQLLRDVIAWETGRFFGRLAEAVSGAPDFPSLLEGALLFAHRAVEEHEVLQKVLQTEPERLLPQLTVESERILVFIRRFLVPYLEREELRPGVEPEEAADYVARMLLSFIGNQGRWDLTDPAQVAELVRTELLAGVLAPH